MSCLQRSSASRISRIATDLTAQGWSSFDESLPRELIVQLNSQALALAARGEFRSAAVGVGSERAIRPEIRTDEICWLSEPCSDPIRDLADHFEELRRGLNRALKLGLFDLELHFARYGIGSFYARHFDRFTGGSRRILSVALYLNDRWRVNDGGALRLYVGSGVNERAIDFLPEAGRLVLFLSDEFEHEVLLVARERFSITGWFCARGDGPSIS